MSFIDSHLLETIGYYFLNSLKNRPQAGIPSRYSLISRFDSKKLLILMVVVIITILIDSEAGLIADFIVGWVELQLEFEISVLVGRDGTRAARDRLRRQCPGGVQAQVAVDGASINPEHLDHPDEVA